MSDEAPKRIWVDGINTYTSCVVWTSVEESESEFDPTEGLEKFFYEYVRADLYEAQAAHIESLQNRFAEATRQYAEQAAEIERLTTLSKANPVVVELREQVLGIQATNANLQAEIERYRRANDSLLNCIESNARNMLTTVKAYQPPESEE